MVPTYRSADIVANPVPKNPVPKNPVPKNPVPKNPVPKNPVPGEPDVYDVISYSWNVTPTSPDDAGTYLALANIDKAYQNEYVFPVFVTKPATAYAVDGCEPANLTTGTLVANISDPSNPVPKYPAPRNPLPTNPAPRNAPPSDVLVQNSSFTLGSSTVVTAASPLSATSRPEVAEKLGTRHLGLTIPFVLFGIFRYLYLVHQQGEGENPAALILSDRPLLTNVLLWGGAVLLVLYVWR